MKFGVYFPTQGPFADVSLLTALARSAEASGWDGFFVWDELLQYFDQWPDSADSWIAMASVASATERLVLGPMVTPVALRSPVPFARQATTLDHLSNGRLILGVGLGNPTDQFTALGEDGDFRVRAEKTDETLSVLTRLWSGERVEHDGKHYQVRGVALSPRPAQRPRIPIWIGTDSRNRKPLDRVARWDGFFPASPHWPDEVISTDEYRVALAYIGERRTSSSSFEVAFMGSADGSKPGSDEATVAEYAAVGVTWWIEQALDLDRARHLTRLGPPPY